MVEGCNEQLGVIGGSAVGMGLNQGLEAGAEFVACRIGWVGARARQLATKQEHRVEGEGGILWWVWSGDAAVEEPKEHPHNVGGPFAEGGMGEGEGNVGKGVWVDPGMGATKGHLQDGRRRRGNRIGLLGFQQLEEMLDGKGRQVGGRPNEKDAIAPKVVDKEGCVGQDPGAVQDHVRWDLRIRVSVPVLFQEGPEGSRMLVGEGSFCAKAVKQRQPSAFGHQEDSGREAKLRVRLEVLIKVARERKLLQVILHANVGEDQFKEEESDAFEG